MEFVVDVAIFAFLVATPFLVIGSFGATILLVVATRRAKHNVEHRLNVVENLPSPPAPTYRDTNCSGCGRPLVEKR